ATRASPTTLERSPDVRRRPLEHPPRPPCPRADPARRQPPADGERVSAHPTLRGTGRRRALQSARRVQSNRQGAAATFPGGASRGDPHRHVSRRRAHPMNAETIAKRFAKARREGRTWRFGCPLCGKPKAWARDHGGKAYVGCFACGGDWKAI